MMVLTDDIKSSLDAQTKYLGNVRENAQRDTKFMKDEAVKRIVKAICERVYDMRGISMPNEEDLAEKINDNIDEMIFYNDEDLRTFISKNVDIVDNSTKGGNIDIPTMLERLQRHVNDYSTQRKDTYVIDEKKKILEKAVEKTIERVSMHIAYINVYNTDYRMQYQGNLEAYIRSVIENEIPGLQRGLDDYFEEKVYPNVNQVTNQLLDYLHSIQSPQYPPINPPQEETELSRQIR